MVLILSFLWPFGGADKKAWRDAEAILHKGLEAERHPQKEAKPHKELPYAFLVRDGSDNVYRVVHDGRLLPRGGGIEALAAYLRGIDAFKRDKLGAGDLVELLKTFGARPASENPNLAFDGELAPALRRAPDALDLVVHAFVPDHTRPGVTTPGPADEQDVERWTLHIDRQRAGWSKEIIKVKRTLKTTL
jgi:hypothetical protein